MREKIHTHSRTQTQSAARARSPVQRVASTQCVSHSHALAWPLLFRVVRPVSPRSPGAVRGRAFSLYLSLSSLNGARAVGAYRLYGAASTRCGGIRNGAAIVHQNGRRAPVKRERADRGGTNGGGRERAGI